MTESQETEREKIESIWIRLIYMVLFFIGHRIASFILGVFAAVQFVIVLVGHNKNDRLIQFATAINKYIYRTGRYLSFETEDKPFPFTDFPASDQPLADPKVTATTAKKAPAKKKPAARKSTAASAARKKTTATKPKSDDTIPADDSSDSNPGAGAGAKDDTQE